MFTDCIQNYTTIYFLYPKDRFHIDHILNYFGYKLKSMV